MISNLKCKLNSTDKMRMLISRGLLIKTPLIICIFLLVFNLQSCSESRSIENYEQLTTQVGNETDSVSQNSAPAYKKSNAFHLFWKALKSTKNSMWTALQVLIGLTIILATIYYISESKYKNYTYPRSLLWAFTHYIGDPGKFSGPGPKSVTGRVISSILGVIRILIVAIPAGILGSGFNQAINEEKEAEMLANDRVKLWKAFERKLDRPSGFRLVPIYKSISDLQVFTGLSENEILNVINNSKGFRLINLARTIPISENPNDKLAVEIFPYNTSYGLFIDRGSPVTIASPSSVIDPAVGYFAFHLAEIGNFNFISRDFGELNPWESYNFVENLDYADKKEYLADLEQLLDRPGVWTFTILAASGSGEPKYDTEIHFGLGNEKGVTDLNNDNIIVKDTATFFKFYNNFNDEVLAELGKKSDLSPQWDVSNPKWWMRNLKQREDANHVVLRIAWSAMLWDDNRILMAKTLADYINRDILGKENFEYNPILKESGLSFDGYNIQGYNPFFDGLSLKKKDGEFRLLEYRPGSCAGNS